MINVQSIDELAQRLAALVPPGLREARDDLERKFPQHAAIGPAPTRPGHPRGIRRAALRAAAHARKDRGARAASSSRWSSSSAPATRSRNTERRARTPRGWGHLHARPRRRRARPPAQSISRDVRCPAQFTPRRGQRAAFSDSRGGSHEPRRRLQPRPGRHRRAAGDVRGAPVRRPAAAPRSSACRKPR